MRRKDNQEVHSRVLNDRPQDAWHLEVLDSGLCREDNDNQKRQEVYRYVGEGVEIEEGVSEKANHKGVRWLCRRFPPSDVW